MVRKLMKHELVALLRVLVWFMLAVVLLGGLARICFETSVSVGVADLGFFSGGYLLAVSLTLLAWIAAVTALFYAATILSVVRFFKTLFTGEGYLTFSLPATPMQLLAAKFFSALLATAACVVAMLVSVAIALPVTAWESLMSVIPEFFTGVWEFMCSEPILFFEVILLLIGILPAGLLYSYLIACIGQLFTKARVAITVILFVVVSSVIEYAFTLLMLPLIIFLEESVIALHAGMWLAIVLRSGLTSQVSSSSATSCSNG